MSSTPRGRAYKSILVQEFPDRDAAAAYAIQWYVDRKYTNVEVASISEEPRLQAISQIPVWDLVLNITQPAREGTLEETLTKSRSKKVPNRAKGNRCESSYKPVKSKDEEQTTCPTCKRKLKVQAIMVKGEIRSRVYPQHNAK
jgi:hypothetical protein